MFLHSMYYAVLSVRGWRLHIKLIFERKENYQ